MGEILYVSGLLGVICFALTGILAGANKGLDFVGIVSLAFVTAVGGGTLRDIILSRSVFWLSDPTYIWSILAATFLGYVLFQYLRPPEKTLLVFDAFGLALFGIQGAQIAQIYTSSIIIIILMGMITGAVGGVIRDICIDQTPALFKANETLYSMTVFAGILLYLGLLSAGVIEIIAVILGMLLIVIFRLACIYQNITFSEFKTKKIEGRKE